MTGCLKEESWKVSKVGKVCCSLIREREKIGGWGSESKGVG